MNKQIRLLVESLFDDEFNDIYNNVNLDTEIASHLLYNYFPISFNELRNLIGKLLKERGKDANLNDIDISNITTFYDQDTDKGLFEGLDPHNINISQWDVSNVTDMSGTFWFCKNFNSNLNNWNVKKVRYMCNMFYNCSSFNSNLSNWETNNVLKMNGMFEYCTNFKGIGLDHWNVKKVNDMSSMFNNCENFNCDLTNWNIKNVKSMISMFNSCSNFKGIGLDHWEINKKTKIFGMLQCCNRLINCPSWYNDKI